MIISKNSWHYKFNAKCSSDVKYDTFTTCTYIRHTLKNILLTAGGTIVVLAVLAMLGWIAASILVFLVNGFIALPVTPLLTDMMDLGAVAFIVVSIWGTILGVVNVVYDYVNSEKRREKRRAKDQLLRQALKDKKDGICTLVEFQ